MVLDFVYPVPLCFEEDTRPVVVKDVHYLYFSTMLSLFCMLVVVSVSLATEKPSPEQVREAWGGTLRPNPNTPPYPFPFPLALSLPLALGPRKLRGKGYISLRNGTPLGYRYVI